MDTQKTATDEQLPTITPTNTSLPDPFPSLLERVPVHTPKSRIRTLLPLVILILGIGSIVLYGNRSQELRKQASSSGVVLKMTPATKTIKKGDIISVGITIATGTDTVAAADLAITWDKTKLQATTMTVGPFLPEVLVPIVITDDTATVTVGLKKTGNTLEKPKKGSGILATISLKAIAPGTGAITFTNSTAVAAINKTTNAIVKKTGSQITIVSETGETPTPTSINSPTPTKKAIITTIKTPTPKATSTKTPTPTKQATSGYQNTPTPTEDTEDTTTFGDILAPTNIPEPTSIPVLPHQQGENAVPYISEESREQEAIDSSIPTIPSDDVALESDISPAILNRIIAAILQFFQNLF